jgi:hypothetical protein
MKVYLSIDLDYWANHCLFSAKQCNTFFKKLADVNVKKFKFVKHHEGLLRHASDNNCDTLVNVDFHSDLTNLYSNGIKSELNEGTWVSFVSWRKEGSFIWMLPSKSFEEWGYCQDTTIIRKFEDLNFKNTGWKKIKKQIGTRNIKWKDVCAVGICLSPEWLEYSEPLRCVLPSLFGNVVSRSKFSLNKYKFRKNFPIIDRDEFLECLAKNIIIQKQAGRNERDIRKNNLRC